MVIVNYNARKEHAMNAKRERIVAEDLGYDTLPRAKELGRFQPINRFVGRARDGRVVDYCSLGGEADLKGASEAFSVTEYVNLALYFYELDWIILDALCGIEGRDISTLSFVDFAQGDMGAVMGCIECTSSLWKEKRMPRIFLYHTDVFVLLQHPRYVDAQAVVDPKRNLAPSCADSITFLVNFPAYFRMCISSELYRTDHSAANRII